ncbi:MAG: gliding motility-associated C-terminal domain-containing protein, partial [Flavobacteriia bacterium]|nr:gliding motility-associated C-terminal domain-containing protein [Flavobacteriia bacterium]
IVKLVKIEPDFNFYVPNVFTPNDDGRNDTFLPVTRGLKFYTIEIFNRWGQLLFKTKDAEQGWNGTYNGNNCQQDVYVWKITLSTLSGELKEYKGHVTLIR